MIRFAVLLAQGTPTEARLAAHAAQAPEDAEAARALLSGTRPKRIATSDTLLSWVAEATRTPPFLVAACLAASGDKSEVAALLLPDPEGAPLTLTETLTTLSPETYLSLARRLPVPARMILNRLATGTFRTKRAEPVLTAANPGTCLAILTLLSPSEATFALPHGNGLVPLTRLPLTLPEAGNILAWARANTNARFGPIRELTPTLVFEIGFEATTPNSRRKSGLDLVAPRLIAWHPDLTPDRATPLASLQTR